MIIKICDNNKNVFDKDILEISHKRREGAPNSPWPREMGNKHKDDKG